MGKSIIITESQYERIFLNEQEEEDPCLGTDKRLSYIKGQFKLPKSGLGVPPKLNPQQSWVSNFGCHLGYSFKTMNLTYNFYFFEKPNFMVVIDSGGNSEFDFTMGQYPELVGLTKIKLWGNYDFKFPYATPDGFKVVSYVKDGQTVKKGNEMITEFKNSFKDLFDDIFKQTLPTGEEKITIDTETQQEINNLSNWVDDEEEDDMLRVSEFIYDKFNGDCQSLENFKHLYQNSEETTLFDEIQGMTYYLNMKEYNGYRDDLLRLLNDCSARLFNTLSENIKQMKINEGL